jgi:hypothetical protein
VLFLKSLPTPGERAAITLLPWLPEVNAAPEWQNGLAFFLRLDGQ